ncbi:MAG: hypothetical protein B5M54_06815 [Candidatus Aminicenantes bacterium 4484_214]|nr:MAG: hypothetical protein B5M54_06815 [Candidatus Aminicenantes bacterium 4484_214]
MKKVLLVTLIFLGLTGQALAADSLATIERAFLLNKVSLLKNLLPEKRYLNLSFPPPLSFSDTFSAEQTYLIFKHIFARFKTQEFYSIHLYSLEPSPTAILKSRWAFQDKKTNKRYVLDVYFFLQAYSSSEKNHQPSPEKNLWEIIEIKGLRR